MNRATFIAFTVVGVLTLVGAFTPLISRTPQHA